MLAHRRECETSAETSSFLILVATSIELRQQSIAPNPTARFREGLEARIAPMKSTPSIE
jgi:hypothetical protein